jgi:uncharacterized protein (UPF0332 family)
MATMVSRLLDAAELSIEDGGNSSAFRRRAVSTAYYAVFHALAKHCADELLQPIAGHSHEYHRAYRALEHGTLKSAFSRHSSKNLREIGALVVKLQSERHRADYLPPVRNVFSRSEAQNLVGEARKAVVRIESLNKQERQTLATLYYTSLRIV